MKIKDGADVSLWKKYKNIDPTYSKATKMLYLA
jgi:hypothetical protein